MRTVLQVLSFGGTVGLLTLIFSWYWQSDFLLMLANQVWTCW